MRRWWLILCMALWPLAAGAFDLPGLSNDSYAYREGLERRFPAGGTAHHLENRTDADCVILEVGDRTPDDAGEYPLDDLVAVQGPDGRWHYSHKDGSPW